MQRKYAGDGGKNARCAVTRGYLTGKPVLKRKSKRRKGRLPRKTCGGLSKKANGHEGASAAKKQKWGGKTTREGEKDEEK